MWDRFEEYVSEVRGEYWAWLSGAAITVVTIVLSLTTSWLPAWAVVFPLFLGLSFAQFKAWQKIRLDNDAKDRQVKALFDSYAYQLFLTDAPSNFNQGESGYQGAVKLLNRAPHPIKFVVKQFHVWIDGAGLADQSNNHIGSILPAQSDTLFYTNHHPQITLSKPYHEIIMEVTILYGHPDKPPTRRWYRKMMVRVNAQKREGQFTLSAETESAI